MASLRINSKEFNNAVTIALECTYSTSLQYDNEDTHRLTPGCEDLLYFSDDQKSEIVYDKFNSEISTPLSKNEKNMIDNFIKNNMVTVLEDAKMYLLQTPGTNKSYPFVTLPNYDERMRDIKKATDIALEYPQKYSKFLEKIHRNEMLYYDAIEICNPKTAVVSKNTKRHLNKAMGTDSHSEGVAAVALMGGGAVAAEAFQALRGQKGPIRTVAGKAWNLTKSKDSMPDEPSNKANNKNGDSPINQNDSTHDGTSSKNSDTSTIEKKTLKENQFQSVVDIDKIFDQYYNVYS